MSTTYKIVYLRTNYQHGKDLFRQPIGCLAMQLKGNTVNYAVSVAHPADVKSFNKEVARKIAVGRCAERPSSVELTSVDKVTYTTATEAVMKCVLKDESIPKRIRQSAKLWLDSKKELNAKKVSV